MRKLTKVAKNPGGAGETASEGHDQILDFTLGEDKILLKDGLLMYWDVAAVGEQCVAIEVVFV